ncbi:hypothetical protein BDQ17DRAFT_1248041, partial [Cyathus striatus]
VLPSITIPSSPFIHFLGVLIDRELHWTHQHTLALARGQSWLSCVWQLSHPSSGASTQVMHQLYTSTAIPHMLYAADIWAQPPNLSLDHLAIFLNQEGFLICIAEDSELSTGSMTGHIW